MITVIPDKGPQAKGTDDLVKDLRDYHDDAKDKYSFLTEISGQSVINLDMSKKLNNAIPVFAGIIVALAFLLMLVFRSIIIPLKAVGGFLLSLTATLGFTTLVMQEGFMKQLFGVHETAPVLAFLPVIVIGILFGLAMDYEVFLMSRIHEEYSRTRDNKHSIKVGIRESGPVIIAAALIMISVFMAFAIQDDVMIKTMGIALAFGVFFDAFVVRLLMIPALTALFGKAAWYLPAWLNRILPKIDIEGHALEDMMPREDYITEQEERAAQRRKYSVVNETADTRNLTNNCATQQTNRTTLSMTRCCCMRKTMHQKFTENILKRKTLESREKPKTPPNAVCIHIVAAVIMRSVMMKIIRIQPKHQVSFKVMKQQDIIRQMHNNAKIYIVS